jgi:hypothetical protein
MTKHLLIALSLLLALPAAQARDTQHMFSIEEALSTPDAESKVDEDVRLYFGEQKHPAIETNHGELKTNKKTNAFGKSEKEACQWAFLSAIIALQSRAVEMGADAVVNIRSNYKSNEKSSTDKFECGAGNVIAGVALKGEFVEFAE